MIYAEPQAHDRMGEKLKSPDKEPGFVRVIRYKNKDDEIFEGETRAFSLKDSDGNVTAHVGLIRQKEPAE